MDAIIQTSTSETPTIITVEESGIQMFDTILEQGITLLQGRNWDTSTLCIAMVPNSVNNFMYDVFIDRVWLYKFEGVNLEDLNMSSCPCTVI